MSAQKGPIFLCGSSRSGTSLLSACLNNNADLHIARETHYFDDLRPRVVPRDGRDTPGNVDELATTYFRRLDTLPYGHGGDPQKSTITPEQLQSLARTLGGTPDAYLAAYCTIKAEQHGKKRWGEKTPRHVYRIADIFEAFPDAKVVYIIRDPRAVVASYRDFKSHGEFSEEMRKAFEADEERARRSYHVYIISLMWRSAVRAGREAVAKFGENRVRIIRYEDLVGESENLLKSLSEFLDLEYSPGMLEVAMNNSSYNRVDAGTGISADAVKRWLKKLSPREIAAIQKRCRSEMQQYGYDLEPVPAYPLHALKLWCTFPFAVWRAARANRARFANLPDYLWRRVRGAFG